MSFIAVSKVSFPSDLAEEVKSVGREMTYIAQQQPGFIAISLNVSKTKDETMMVWEWQSQADHEACLGCDEWISVMTQFAHIFQVEGVGFSVETFERIG